MNTMIQNYIQHYGVKGMKWGVRKRPVSPSGASRTPKATPKKSSFSFLRKKKKTSSKKASSKPVEKKSVKKMTNDELNAHIKRLEMEKKYKELKKSDISIGQKLASGIMQKSVENIGTQLATYALGTAVNKAFKSEIVNPKKGQRDKK